MNILRPVSYNNCRGDVFWSEVAFAGPGLDFDKDVSSLRDIDGYIPNYREYITDSYGANDSDSE